MKIFNTKNCIVGFSDKADGDLNFYEISEKQRETVRQSISVQFGKELPFPFYICQIHKADVVEVAEDRSFPTPSTEADAIITNQRNVPIGIFTADCCPVLMGSTESISATHAGWKSTCKSICIETVKKHKELYGVNPEDLTAWIGPCIGQCCFELGDEVYEQFVGTNPSWAQFFIKTNKWHLNLRALNRYQLTQAGIPDNQIIDYDQCTMCQADKYFSYRREHKKNGSMFSLIVR